MRKNLVKCSMVFMATFFITVQSQAQHFVKVRPRETIVVTTRPPAPTPGHVWVEGDWVWRGNAYVHEQGRWISAPYRGARWIPGHWKENPRRGGWYWVTGHWRKR